MSVSESSSSTQFPQYRLKRKPPPTIDVAEKYPSPDPHDPFAPLWVLRNRTSSALGQKLLVTKDTPSPYSEPPIRTHQGPLMDTFKVNSALHSIPIERRRSNSYLLPHSTTNTTHAIPPRSSSTVPQNSNNGVRTVHTFNRRPSQSGSTTTGGGLSHPPMKPAHPQVISDNTLRSNAMSRTDKQRNDPKLAHSQPRAPGNIVRRLTVDMRTSDNSSGNETESDLSIPAPGHPPHRVDVKVKAIDVESQGKPNNAGLTTTISFNVGVDVKPTLLRRAASNGTTSTGSASLARNVPPQQPMSQQSRLAKFLLPKKASHDGYMADGEKRNIKHQKGPVHKLSISAPLTDSFVHERSKSQQSKDDHSSASLARNPNRSKGGHTSDTDLEEGTGGIRLRGVLFRARKKASRDDTRGSAPSNSTLESADPVVPIPAVVADKPKYLDGKETERRRPEMSCAEVNVEAYYTPITSPRGSYPTPAPSPQLKPALELEQDAPLDGEKVKGSKLKSNGREAEVKTNSEIGNKGFTTEVKGQLETVGVSVSETDANPVKTQASRARKSKATNTPGSAILNPSVPATTTVVHFPSPPASVPPTSASITPTPPPPPPKVFKRRTSSSTPAQAEGTPSSSPSGPSQLTSAPSTSIVHANLISVPKPSGPPLNEDASAFVKPRRAPRPPGTVEGVQSEPEPIKRERFDDLWRGSKEDKRQSRKDKHDGRMKTKPKSDDEVQVLKRQNMDAAVKEMKVPEMDMKPSSQPLVSVVKHCKAASTDFACRKNMPCVGLTEGSDGVSKKATVPVSMSTPAYLSSKGTEIESLPQSQSQASRPIFHPKGLSPDNSFNSFGFPLTEYSLPTRTQLSHASSLPVYTEDGRKHLFGSLFEKQKTVVIFIRHFWCPLCQDYMSVVKSTVTPDMIVADGWIKAGAEEGEDEVVWKKETKRIAEMEKIGLVVISNGAHAMIAKYRQIFSLPFRVYTDPSLAIYKLLGMGKTGADCQDPQHSHPTNYLSDSPAPPMPKKKKHNYSLRKKADTSVSSLSDREREQGGGYIKHGLMSGIAMVVVRAFKVGMPVWEKGGDVGQLGGEFVFGPGLICTYAHKMQSSKGHAPIEEVLQAAGVKLNSPPLPRPSSPAALKPESAQKQTNSVDLSSPPKSSRHPQGLLRNRKESLKGPPEAISSRTSTIIANATTIKSISHAQPLGSSQRGERERRNDQSPSPIPKLVTTHTIIPPTLPPALKAVMTREEQTRWVEERQKSIEKTIQDRGNNVKRLGTLGRSPTSQAQGGPSARSTQGNIKEGRGNTFMTESRSTPMRSLEEEERIVYKAEGRRVQERTRGSDVHHGPGSGHVQNVSTSRTGRSATTSGGR